MDTTHSTLIYTRPLAIDHIKEGISKWVSPMSIESSSILGTTVTRQRTMLLHLQFRAFFFQLVIVVITQKALK